MCDLKMCYKDMLFEYVWFKCVLYKDVYLSSHIKMWIVESLLVFMHIWSVLFNDVVFNNGVGKISSIRLMSKISVVPMKLEARLS